MSESLKFLEENKLKLSKLEDKIQILISDLDKVDEIELECKINEYKNVT